MKIVQLESSNLKRLVAVEINPDGNLVVIGGRNGQGKTSVLDSIMYAMAGERSICTKPVRSGQKKAKVVCTLDDLVVTRTFTDEGGGALTVTSRDGKSKYSSPQYMLNELVGKLSFDPLDFCRLKPAQQLETLRALVGLDFSALDAKRKKLFDERAVAGRDVNGRKTQIESMPRYPEAPADEISVAELAQRLEAIDAHNDEQRDRERSIADANLEVENAEAEIRHVERKIEELQKELERWQKARDLRAESRDDLPKPEPLQDREPIRQQIVAAEETNKKVRANAARAALEKNFADAKQTYDELTDQIESIDKEKERQLQSTTFPVNGLSLSDDGVLFNGLPFDQASSAEQLRISVAMGLALNPKLKVLLIRDGSLLDDDSLRMVAEMAERADGQVWIERVGEGAECSVIIEDGSVKPTTEQDNQQKG